MEFDVTTSFYGTTLDYVPKRVLFCVPKFSDDFS